MYPTSNMYPDDHGEDYDDLGDSAYPDDNPKSIMGATKVPLHLNPATAAVHQAAAHADGAAKYGAYNWRSTPVAISVYVAAVKRHLDAYYDSSETYAADSGVHHLGHAMAGLAILLDAEACGTLVDDRPVCGATVRLQAEYAVAKAHAQAPESLRVGDKVEIIGCASGLDITLSGVGYIGLVKEVLKSGNASVCIPTSGSKFGWAYPLSSLRRLN